MDKRKQICLLIPDKDTLDLSKADSEDISLMNWNQNADIQKINISMNTLSDIPIEIMNLNNLKFITIYLCNFTYIPKEIGNLTNLIMLSICTCKLIQIPKEIGNLVKLQRLYLRENEITNIPKEIGNLKNLEELYLNRNRIRDLTEEIISNLPKLKCLDISSNRITVFPQFMLKNKNATIVNSFLFFKNISKLYLSDNLFHPIINNWKLTYRELYNFFKNCNITWRKGTHKHGCLWTKKTIQTMLILNIKDIQTKQPKYKQSLISILPKELLFEIFEYLPIFEKME